MVHDRPNTAKLDRRIFECDDDDLDERGLLRDGRRLRIRVADDETVEDDEDDDFVEVENYVTDAFGRPAGHRPGYVFASDDAAQQRLDDAYAAHDAWLRDAWRNPGSEQAGDASANSARTGDAAQQSLDAAYAEAERVLTNAWRGNKAQSRIVGATGPIPRLRSSPEVDPDEERRRAFNPEALPRVVTAHVAAPARGNNANNNEDDEDPYEAHKRALGNAWRTR
jgi:hypothetical protein